ncbi:MAG: M23 family metallopeptidase [Anaerotruncus sp.]|nr:M23 family metallopeptidase [Anaerotruncus sp.]
MYQKSFAILLALALAGCSSAPAREPINLVSSTAEIHHTISSEPEPAQLLSKAESESTLESSSAPESQIEPATPQVTLSSQSAPLGEALFIHASAVSEGVTAQTTLPHQPKFFLDGDGMSALLPIAYTTPVGNYQLTVSAAAQTWRFEIVVQERSFQVQQLTMDSATEEETALSAQANWEWEQKIEPLKAISTPEKYWEGTFLQPVESYSEITTEYGAIRYTNGSKVASRHSGTDYAAKAGTQVYATNHGVILFADFLQLTGNTVVIDHGFGLKSFYYHMDSLDTQAGAVVKRGDPVGKVGSTGYSTGPHLHYSLLVNNIFINPQTAIDGTAAFI